MTTIKTYKTPQEYLDETENFLYQNELENNLLIGMCNLFTDKLKEYPNCVFINLIEENKIIATSIKINSKAFISSISNNINHIKLIADFYLENKIDLKGVVGKSFHSKKFANFYGKEQFEITELLAHKLNNVNNLLLTSGSFECASLNDLDILTDWTLHFLDATKHNPKRTIEQLRKDTQIQIEKGNLFKWMDNGKLVSIAAIVRKTKNIGIVGLVYTPENLRGKGYATSCVQKLSEHVLKNGFSNCGLFTDKSNPTSNAIYKKIGYVASTEFTDISFR